LSNLGEVERRQYLQRTPEDKGNGAYSRALTLGSLPLSVRVPRTRSGEFRPRSLPPPYERGYAEETQSLLTGLLASSRSVNAAKAALQSLGLSCPETELDQVAQGLIEELDLKNTRPIDPDMLALFIDGKYVELRQGERLRPCCIYVVVGLNRQGRKTVLTCEARPGRENLDDWKAVLRSLIERGLRRVLLLVQDDFSGLLGVTRGFFPNTDIQLCTVHLLRNVRSHLSKPHAAEFKQRFNLIKAGWDPEQTAQAFDDLCQHFAETYPTFIAGLQKKRPHYLSFIQYPDQIRRTLSTTNVVEAINGRLENLRRNAGGYFHSEDTLKFKLGLAINALESGKWQRSAANVQAALDSINAMFESRFEKTD
jgi:transposase-like protein